MILVIADDLTGAAEAGGIALRFGLTAEVQTKFFPVRDVDLIVADTESRTCSAAEASRRVGRTFAQYRDLPVEWCFKKVDSVLRGNVMAEMAALLGTGHHDRALLVPANPGLGRTISQGRYWIDNQPLDHTDFANDPEYPAATSDVKQLLLQRDYLEFFQRWPVTVVSIGETLPPQGVAVSEAVTDSDLLAWATGLDANTIPAGSAEFMGAFLQAIGKRRADPSHPQAELRTDTTTLFMCGSTSASSRQFCRDSEAGGIPVMRMPGGLFDGTGQAPGLIEEWAASTLTALRDYPRVVVAIDQPVHQDIGLPRILSDHLGAVVERVLNECRVEHLLVEGGATAAALVRRMGWTRLRMVRELAPGVVSTRVAQRPDLVLTMKPGSYHWPAEILV